VTLGRGRPQLHPSRVPVIPRSLRNSAGSLQQAARPRAARHGPPSSTARPRGPAVSCAAAARPLRSRRRPTPRRAAPQVRPGQSTLVFYTAHNLSDHAVTGVSTYNVAPQQAGLYFNKIQCFCFEEQKLRPGAPPPACAQALLPLTWVAGRRGLRPQSSRQPVSRLGAALHVHGRDARRARGPRHPCGARCGRRAATRCGADRAPGPLRARKLRPCVVQAAAGAAPCRHHGARTLRSRRAGGGAGAAPGPTARRAPR
jgi:hypothetical protein